MDNKMFCFQCEQTAGCSGCTGCAGVCGKSADVANLQDKLTGSLIGLAGEIKNNVPSAEEKKLIIEGLFTTITNVNFNESTIKTMIDKIHSISGGADYDMTNIWNADEDIRSLKSLILFGIRGMAAYAYHAMVLGYEDETVDAFFVEALNAIGQELGMDDLLPIVMKVGEINFKCMGLLDTANTKSYGNPVPTEVSLTIEKGPFIVVTGHDLLDFKMLLEQTKDKGINIYTHGEMLPAHAYPELKKYSHLKGNFGTAWQNQQKEFADIPGAVLFTTNCLMPPKPSYKDRVFTTEVVSFPDVIHIGEDKDFSLLSKRLLSLVAMTVTGK